MKSEYPTFHVVFARIAYDVECEVFLPRKAPRVGPDHPDYMSPGTPLRVFMLRILRDRVDVGNELLPFTRSGIEELVELEAAAKYGKRPGARTISVPDISVIPAKREEQLDLFGGQR